MILAKETDFIIRTANDAPVKADMVGKCIYCLSNDERGDLLTDEHIIPLGIRGNLILPKASCRECAKLVQSFESFTVNRHFGFTRESLKISSRRNRGRNNKKREEYVIIDGDSDPNNGDSLKTDNDKLAVLEDDSNSIIAYEVVTSGDPGILTGVPPNQPTTSRIGFCFSSKRRTHDKLSFRFRTKGGLFTRTIAKIAHGYAVYLLGIGNFKPLLLDLIRSPDADGADYFVGTIFDDSREEVFHHITASIHYPILPNRLSVSIHPILVIDIRLFAFLGAPVFRVAAAQLSST